MQTQSAFLENIIHAYVEHRLVRLLSALAVLLTAFLLFGLSGGLPPWAWRMLFQSISQFPALLAAHGPGVFLALLGLVLLSLNILLAWGALVWIVVQMLRHWQNEYRERRAFAADIEEAHSIAQGVLEEDEQDSWVRAQAARTTVPPARGGRVYPREYAFASAYREEEEEEEEIEFCEQGEEEDLYPAYQAEELPSQEEEDRSSQAYAAAAIRPAIEYQAAGSVSLNNRAFLVQPPRPAGPGNLTFYGLDLPPGISMAPSAATVNSQHSYHGLFAPFNPSRALQESPSAAASGPGDDWLNSQAGPVQEPFRLSSFEEQQADIPTIPFPVPAPEKTPAAPLSVVPGQGDRWLGRRTVPMQGLPQLNAVYYEQENALVRAQPAPLAVPTAQSAAVQLMVSSGLDAGLKRKGKPNEDSLLALQNTRVLRDRICPVGLFVIADGMGGHNNGQEASRLVVQTLSKTVVPSVIYGPTDDDYAELLAEGIHHANLAIYQRNRQDRGDMGTTIAAALIVNTTAYIANVGDSRVYLYRQKSGLSQVTRDHSTVAQMVAHGLITSDEVYTHPRRNEIYRSLGRHPSEETDTFVISMEPGDLLLLCSDGLWEMVRDHRMQEIIESTLDQPAQLSSMLVQAALEGGGQDNISVIGAYMRPMEAHAARAS